jgi:homoserine O-acetyltransferase
LENKPTTINTISPRSSAIYDALNLSYQVSSAFTYRLWSIMLNGNSQVVGDNGWWNDLIGEQNY